jgi:hypothetical protein
VPSKGNWNSLEAAKLMVALATPLIVLWVGSDLSQAQRHSADIAQQAATKNAQIFQAAQAKQARDFQTQLALADQQSRSALQTANMRWQGFLQDESAARARDTRLADIRRADEIRASDIRRADVQREADAERARKEAVAQISEAIYERRTRAELLASALRRRDAAPSSLNEQELVTRKTNYDESYARWNSNLKANLFKIRGVLRQDTYRPLESLIEFSLVRDIFNPMDGCLTKAYDASIAGKPATPILDQCGMRDLLRRALDCGHDVSEALYQLSVSARPDEFRAEDFVAGACSAAG